MILFSTKYDTLGRKLRYIIKQNGCYYFRRKIPNSTYNFTFSLKTKNSKIAIKKAAYFLRYVEHFFIELKILAKEEIQMNLEEIQNVLEEYKNKALTEYSELETQRHSDFTCKKKKNGKTREGGHPKCIKKWLKTLKEAAFSEDNKEVDELFGRIFKRTNIEKNYFNKLSDRDKNIFKILLLKTEAEVLKEDYYRAKQRFDANIPLQIQQPIIENSQ